MAQMESVCSMSNPSRCISTLLMLIYLSVWTCAPLCLGSQGPPDGADAEEAERCPICLGILAGGDLAVPDGCSHVFCLGCLLTWAEVIQ